MLDFDSLTPPLKPLHSSPVEETQERFLLPKCEEKPEDSDYGEQKERPLIRPVARKNSGTPRDNSSLTGLFALLQVVKDMEKKPKKVSKVTKEAPQICGNKYCAEVREKSSEEWSRRKIGGVYMWLCAKCSQAYNKKQYCEYCRQIYIDTSDKNAVVDGLDWLQCESCKRWTHVHCEKEAGASEIDALLMDPLFVYHCAECEKANPFGRRNGKKKGSHW